MRSSWRGTDRRRLEQAALKSLAGSRQLAAGRLELPEERSKVRMDTKERSAVQFAMSYQHSALSNQPNVDIRYSQFEIRHWLFPVNCPRSPVLGQHEVQEQAAGGWQAGISKFEWRNGSEAPTASGVIDSEDSTVLNTDGVVGFAAQHSPLASLARRYFPRDSAANRLAASSRTEANVGSSVSSILPGVCLWC